MARPSISRRTALKAGGLALGLGLGPSSVGARPAPHEVFALDFQGPSDADEVGASTAGWLVDRQDTGTWESAQFDGDRRLHIVTDGTGPTSGFRDYQGRKYLPESDGHWNTGHGSVLGYRFYVDPAWEKDSGDGVGHETGMWCVIADGGGSIAAYAILEYQDSDANAATDENPSANPAPDGPQFRMWLQTGEWLNLGLPRKTRVDPEEGGWVDVHARMLFDGSTPKVLWHVNDARLATDDTIGTFGNPTTFLEPILNTKNFGADEDHYYDDIRLLDPGREG